LETGHRATDMLGDVLAEVAKMKCSNYQIKTDRTFRAHQVPCGHCIVCVAREVVKG
jgi:hypothetical protein